MIQQQADGLIHHSHLAGGRGGPQLNNDVRHVAFVFLQPLQRVLKNRQVQGVVRREFGRAQERSLRTPFAGDCRDLFIVRGNDHPGGQFGLQPGSDRIGDQRIAGKGFDVFAGDALGTTPRRDNS